MKRSDAKAIARRYVEGAWNLGNVEDLAAYVAADRVHYRGTRAERFGSEENAAFIQMWRTALPDIRFEINEVIAEGGTAMVRSVFTGTHRGPLTIGGISVDATGRYVEEAHLMVFHVQEDMITESWAFWDSRSVLRQLGQDV